MNLFINSPSYYTQEYGVIDEIYRMCAYISENIDIRLYTECLDTVSYTHLDVYKRQGEKKHYPPASRRVRD